MPSINTSIQVKGDQAQILDMLIKAGISSGCEVNQIADNIVVAKRGMSGISWGLEINLSFVCQSAKSAMVQINGSIAGYGPIQKAELQKCIDLICNNLCMQQASSQRKDDVIPEVFSEINQVPAHPQRPSQQAILPMNLGTTSLDANIAYLMKELSHQERILFQSEYTSNKKSVTNGVLLALFLGGLGIHKFWLNEVRLGILYLVFFWTFVPALVAILDACLMGNSVKNYNLKVANAAYQKIIIMR